MDSSLDQFKGTQARRQQRKAKGNSKFSQSAALKINAKYRTALRSSEPLSEQKRAEIRERIIIEESKTRRTRIITASALIICLVILIAYFLK